VIQSRYFLKKQKCITISSTIVHVHDTRATHNSTSNKPSPSLSYLGSMVTSPPPAEGVRKSPRTLLKEGIAARQKGIDERNRAIDAKQVKARRQLNEKPSGEKKPKSVSSNQERPTGVKVVSKKRKSNGTGEVAKPVRSKRLAGVPPPTEEALPVERKKEGSNCRTRRESAQQVEPER
jgi:hypothetical protein